MPHVPAARRTTARWVAVVAGTAVLSGTAVWMLTPRSSPAQSALWSVSRLAVSPPAGVPLAVDSARVAVSPDGRSVAYVAGRGRRQQIYLRDLDQFDSIPIPGTEGASNPFFSPDSQWLGFSAAGGLKKVLRSGGTPSDDHRGSRARGVGFGAEMGGRRHDSFHAHTRRWHLAGFCRWRNAKRGDNVGGHRAQSSLAADTCLAAKPCYSAHSPAPPTPRSTLSRSRPASAARWSRAPAPAIFPPDTWSMFRPVP